MLSRGAFDRAVALALFVGAAAYLRYAFEIRLPPSSDDSPLSARSLPFAVGVLAMALAAIIALKPAQGEPLAFKGPALRRVLALGALMAFYALAITRLGFVVTTALFLAGGFGVLGERRPVVLASVSLGTSLGFWLLFRQLDVALDWGVFEGLLG